MLSVMMELSPNDASIGHGELVLKSPVHCKHAFKITTTSQEKMTD